MDVPEVDRPSDGFRDKAVRIRICPGGITEIVTCLVARAPGLRAQEEIGDTVLPGITPYPSQESFFDDVKEILPPAYKTADSVYGLRAYLRSLKRLKEIGRRFPDMIVLPAHRLFYNNRWIALDLQSRIDELINHHIDRCTAIVEILNQGEKTAEEIAREYFPANLLKGLGQYMAANEILSHCELLLTAGDIAPAGGNQFTAAGCSNIGTFIQSL